MRKSIYLEDGHAEEYDIDRYGGKFARFMHDQEVAAFLELSRGVDGTVLDLGAGTGKLSLPLVRQSRQVVLADPSPQMLGVARRKAQAEGKELTCVICDAHALCFRDRSFGCVISSRVLMHLADWRSAIAEVCRIADHVILDFPPSISFTGLDSRLKHWWRRFSPAARAYQAFSPSTVSDEFRSNDFHVISISRRFFLPVALHRRLNSPALSLLLENVFKILGLLYLLGAPVTLAAARNEQGVGNARSYGI